MAEDVLLDLHKGMRRLIYAHLGVLVLSLALAGAGAYFGLKSYDKALAHAETLQAQFNTVQTQFVASQRELTELLAKDSAQRTVNSAQQAKIEAQMAQRDSQKVPPAVAQALEPNADVKIVVSALQSVYNFGDAPKVEPDGMIAVTVPNAQIEVSEEVNAKRFSADLQDETQLFTLEQAKSTSLGNDLSACQSTLSTANVALGNAQKTLAAYNKLVHRSKFRKILGSVGRNAERIGILVVGFEVGRRL